MKIDMTEDEAMRGFFKNWLGEREEGVRFFRTVMNLLGLEFREEEPEMPEIFRGDFFVHVRSGKRFYIEDQPMAGACSGPWTLYLVEELL